MSTSEGLGGLQLARSTGAPAKRGPGDSFGEKHERDSPLLTRVLLLRRTEGEYF